MKLINNMVQNQIICISQNLNNMVFRDLYCSIVIEGRILRVWLESIFQDLKVDNIPLQLILGWILISEI